MPVRGGDLAVDLGGPDPSWSDAVVLLVPGLSATAAVWSLVMSRLPASVSAIAVDLRGRGGSADLPGPYGLEVHADDLAATLDSLAVDRAVIVGHGAGAVLAGVFAERYPARVGALVLVDGGVGSGPAVPAAWTPGPTVRPEHRLSEEAVSADAADLVVRAAAVHEAARLDVPAELLRAQWGRVEPDPPLLAASDEVDLRQRFGRLRAVTVPGVGHDTIVTLPQGADAVAAAIGRAIRAAPAGP